MIFLQKQEFFNFLEENNLNGALIGIDYGSKHIGIAITNTNRTYSLQLQTIDFELGLESNLFQFTEEELIEFKSNISQIEYFSAKWNALFLKLEEIILEKKIIACVIGFPLKINENMQNIKQHVELFALALDNFFYSKQLETIDFEKIKLELEISDINLELNKKNLFEDNFLRKKIDKFPILLQDERYSSKQVLTAIREEKKQFLHNHHLVNKKFKENYKKYDEDSEKSFRAKNSKKINNLRKFKKFQEFTIKKTKNTNAAVNILNSAIEN